MNRNLGPTVEGRDYSCPLPTTCARGRGAGLLEHQSSRPRRRAALTSREHAALTSRERAELTSREHSSSRGRARLGAAAWPPSLALPPPSCEDPGQVGSGPPSSRVTSCSPDPMRRAGRGPSPASAVGGPSQERPQAVRVDHVADAHRCPAGKGALRLQRPSGEPGYRAAPSPEEDASEKVGRNRGFRTD